MSSLLPLIVLSIALLHCAAASKCLSGTVVYSSTGERVTTQAPQEVDCASKCIIQLQRDEPAPSKYTVYSDCDSGPLLWTGVDQFVCKSWSALELSCHCDPATQSICNTPELVFAKKDDKAQKDRVKMARKIGLDPQPLDGKVSFKWLDFKCQKWTVTYTVTDDKFEEKEIDKQDVEGCPSNLCFTSISSDSGAKTKSVKSGCSTQGRPTQVKPYEHEAKDHSIDVYCLANPDSPCNTLELMFLSAGDAKLTDRTADLKAKTKLEVESYVSRGKTIVDFKWRNCLNYQYDMPLKGERQIHSPLIKAKPCKSGVCFMFVTRSEQKDNEKIVVNAGCEENPEEPLVTDIKCQTTLEELTSRCWCPAKKVSCNQNLNLFDIQRTDQQIRREYLRKIGIHVEIKTLAGNTGSGEFKYDVNYGTTAPEEIVTVSGETTVPLPSTARPPSQLPEDDPYYEELLGSATGLSMAFCVVLPILRLI